MRYYDYKIEIFIVGQKVDFRTKFQMYLSHSSDFLSVGVF